MCGISVVVPLRRVVSPGNHSNGINGTGVNGVNGVNRSSTSLEKRLASSLDLIAHRGPDAQGIWTDPTKTLGELDLAPARGVYSQ